MKQKKIGFTKRAATPEPVDPAKVLVTRDPGELDFANAPKEIEKKKNESVLPVFTVMSEEILRRFETGELGSEVKGMKLSSLINNLTKLIAAMQKSAIVIVNPGAPQLKDPVHLRKNSAMHLTEAEKQARRDAANAVDAEVVDPKDAK